MLARVLVVVAAWFGAGALLMLEQRRAGGRSSRTGWRKYAVYLALVVGLLALADAGRVAFVVATSAILVAALIEYFRAAPVAAGAAVPLTAAGVLVGAAGLLAGPPALYGATVGAALVILAAGAVSRDGRGGAVGAAWGVTGIVAVAAPGAHVLLLAEGAERFARFAFLFVVVGGADAFAELVGRRWPAGRGIVPASPGKTASGIAGGCAAAVLVALTLRFLQPAWTPAQVAAAGLALAVAGGLGDLIASSLKRAFGIKDFGAWLPGQGGALDRFDSFLFAAVPFYWLTRAWQP